MDQMQTPNDVPVAGPARTESGLSFKGLIRVFTEPTKFFEQVKDDPKVLVPVLTIFALVLLMAFLLMDQILDAQYQMQAEGFRSRGMTEAQIQQIMQSPWMKVSPLLGSIFVMASPFITGGLALLFGSFMMGGKAKYMQAVCVMAYAEVVYYASSMINIPFQMMKGNMTPPLSLAVLFPDLTFQDPLFVLLAKISPMYVWHVIVAGIGLAIIYKFSRNKGYLLAVLSLGLLSALHVGSALLGTMAQ